MTNMQRFKKRRWPRKRRSKHGEARTHGSSTKGSMEAQRLKIHAEGLAPVSGLSDIDHSPESIVHSASATSILGLSKSESRWAKPALRFLDGGRIARLQKEVEQMTNRGRRRGSLASRRATAKSRQSQGNGNGGRCDG